MPAVATATGTGAASRAHQPSTTHHARLAARSARGLPLCAHHAACCSVTGVVRAAAAGSSSSRGRGSRGLGRRALRVTAFNADYSAAENSAYWETRPVAVAKRAVAIAQEFVRWRVRTALADAKAVRAAQRGVKGLGADFEQPGRSVGAALARDALCRLGPAFVKIGQALSSRPDVLPPAYLRELEALQDRIPAFSDAEAYAVLEAELGAPPSAIFSELSPSPVAAASLGQVYKGVLRDSGEAVAVKVQRPGVAAAIALDVFILRWLAAGLRAARRLNTDLPALVDEWATSLFRELDYTREAANAARFKALYEALPRVYVPRVYDRYTTAKVLVMEWVVGERLRSASSRDRLEAVEARAMGGPPGSLPGPPAGKSGGAGVRQGGLRGSDDDIALVEVGVQCSLEQMLRSGFYHADPHPGNLLRTADGRLAYLDFGMCGELDAATRTALIRATLHLVNREYSALGDDFTALGLLPRGADRASIVPALTGVFTTALAGGVANVSFGDLSTSLGATMYKYGFQIPPYYTLLVRSLSVLEGIALASDPGYKVLGAAYPWVARTLLTGTTPELQPTLSALLVDPATRRFRFSRLESLLREAVRNRRPPPAPGGTAAPLSAAQATSPLALLLAPEAAFVRGILLEEVAKGVDAGWRVAGDAAADSARAALPLPARSVLAVASRLPLVGALLRPLAFDTFTLSGREGEEGQGGAGSSSTTTAVAVAPPPPPPSSSSSSGRSSPGASTAPSPSPTPERWSTGTGFSGEYSAWGPTPPGSPSPSLTPSPLAALTSLAGAVPRLASQEDAEQLRGISQLASALRDIAAAHGADADAGASSSGNGDGHHASEQPLSLPLPPLPVPLPAGTVPSAVTLPPLRALPLPPDVPQKALDQVAQAALVATWLAAELSALPPEAHATVASLPAELAQRVASRVAARAIRSTL